MKGWSSLRFENIRGGFFCVPLCAALSLAIMHVPYGLGLGQGRTDGTAVSDEIVGSAGVP